MIRFLPCSVVGLLWGDINNDGFNDLFISAKMWDEPELEEGKLGSIGVLPPVPLNRVGVGRLIRKVLFLVFPLIMPAM